jgi:predicted nuclease of predicted toxin-antitoxin system
VKFLIDAQLPARLARFLNDAGHDALHTSELPQGNRTTDVQIAERADHDGRALSSRKIAISGTATCWRGHHGGC